MEIKILESIDQCSSSLWDSLFDSDYPFLKHNFISLLESSGSVCEATGWIPKHLLLESDGITVAAIPLYLKYHSYGEYVFDQSWADAYSQHGIPYYPKLVSAIPFTPVAGPRIGIAKGFDREKITKELLEKIKLIADKFGASSWHLLFPEYKLMHSLIPRSAMRRVGVQYHWKNDNYINFDDFIITFASRKRKNLLKERRKAKENLNIFRLVGNEITPSWWEYMYTVYQQTYLKRNGTDGYLTRKFFEGLGSAMGSQVMLSVAEGQGDKAGVKVAASLFFFDDNSLYGRYWGCHQEYDFLHFELCYHQGIEHAIEKKLSVFNAGAQGEHKISRGFIPVEVYSSHWIKHPEFSKAINAFLEQESVHIKEYISLASKKSPYK